MKFTAEEEATLVRTIVRLAPNYVNSTTGKVHYGNPRLFAHVHRKMGTERPVSSLERKFSTWRRNNLSLWQRAKTDPDGVYQEMLVRFLPLTTHSTSIY